MEDAALLLNVITGHDPKDSTSVQMEQADYTAFLKEDLAGMRIALPKEYYELDYNPEVKENVLAAVKKMEAEGAVVEEVSIPYRTFCCRLLHTCYWRSHSNLACYDDVALVTVVKRRAM